MDLCYMNSKSRISPKKVMNNLWTTTAKKTNKK